MRKYEKNILELKLDWYNKKLRETETTIFRGHMIKILLNECVSQFSSIFTKC